ncbi:MAG: EscE/YscE/SsaE family type III secretion system needle protein co-chaperone [Puniceicoccales bacterium]|jgi:hypothetical protein|nr:EscE/YscE/SsaE family type III secretion system needle protein co-chaperone [Puniceicoccales bacterium]
MVKKERITLIEMERRLLNDTDGSYRQELLRKLEEYQQFVKSRINSGLDPQGFDIFNKLKQALESAKDTIISFK